MLNVEIHRGTFLDLPLCLPSPPSSPLALLRCMTQDRFPGGLGISSARHKGQGPVKSSAGAQRGCPRPGLTRHCSCWGGASGSSSRGENFSPGTACFLQRQLEVKRWWWWWKRSDRRSLFFYNYFSLGKPSLTVTPVRSCPSSNLLGQFP